MLTKSWFCTILRTYAQILCLFELSLVAKFQVCSTFPSGRFWWGLLVIVSCDGGETKSIPSPPTAWTWQWNRTRKLNMLIILARVFSVPTGHRLDGRQATLLVAINFVNIFFSCPSPNFSPLSHFLIKGVIESKHLLRWRPFQTPPPILDFGGGAVLHAVSECPRRC